MVFDGVSKRTKDPVVDQMMDKATKVLEAVVDESWVPWVDCLIPNVSHRVRAKVDTKAHEAHDCKIREEAECIIEEKLKRAVNWDKRLKDKLTEVLEGQMTQEAFERDSETEEVGETEESEAIGMEDFGTMGGTQLSAMEVNEEEEDEVVVVEVIK